MMGRRRIVILLILTSVLLLTIDLRGNSGFDALRSGFQFVMSPFETAAQVITRPIIVVWRSIARYDDIVDENRALREQLDAQRGAEIAARSALVENQQLRALNALESVANLPSVTAAIIGESPSNNDQVIEIDRGRDQGIQVGMAVTNEAGLVGKVTEVFARTSFVMLITDPRYAVEAKVVSSNLTLEPDVTGVTVPSGLALDELESAATEPPPAEPEASLPDPANDPANEPVTDPAIDPAADPETVPADPATDAATDPAVDPAALGDLTPEQVAVLEAFAAQQGLGLDQLLGLIGDAATAGEIADDLVEDDDLADPEPLVIQRETGALIGQGPDRLPQIDFVLTSPTLSEIKIGDAVLTTGGRASLAPPDIPIGVVANIIVRPGAAGARLEIRPAADLRRLQFVRVVLYKPSVERDQ